MLMSDLLLQGPHPILVAPTPGPQTPLPSLHTITYSPLPLFKALVQQEEPPPPRLLSTRAFFIQSFIYCSLFIALYAFVGIFFFWYIYIISMNPIAM